jgi:hypothetical protein
LNQLADRRVLDLNKLLAFDAEEEAANDQKIGPSIL